MPKQYTGVFFQLFLTELNRTLVNSNSGDTQIKNIGKFHMKTCDIFLTLAKNIDCGHIFESKYKNQSRTNGPINAHLTIAQV